MNIKSAIFDMDGTLVDSLFFWDVFWDIISKKYLDGKKFTPTPDDDKYIRTSPFAKAMNLLHENYDIGENGEDLLKTMVESLGEFYAKDVKPKDGVKEFLDYLQSKGIKMCIASATSPDLIKVALKHCGIDKYFSKLFSCGELGVGKDRPDIYLLAKNYLGSEIADTFVFEDSLVAIETAVKIGMPTVGIYDKFNPGQERIKEIATEYIADGETLLKLVGEIL